MSDIRTRYAWPDAQVEVRISLEIQFPGMAHPFFIEGMKVIVDRYMYERYEEHGELEQWLHHQAVTHLMDHSRANRVAIGVGP